MWAVVVRAAENERAPGGGRGGEKVPTRGTTTEEEEAPGVARVIALKLPPGAKTLPRNVFPLGRVASRLVSSRLGFLGDLHARR